LALEHNDLKNVQERLAERLRIAREQGVIANWLAVTIDGMNCLFPASQINEVLPSANIIPVPYAKAWFMGVIKSRGRIYGVVDFSNYLSSEVRREAISAQKATSLTETSLIALSADLNLNCVLLVQKVHGLRTIEDFPKSAPPDPHLPEYFGPIYQDTVGANWQEINIQRLSRSPVFLGICV